MKHGVKRTQRDEKLKDIYRAQQLEKIKQYQDLLSSHQSLTSADGTTRQLELSEALLTFNPEHYTAWNSRRRLLEKSWPDGKESTLHHELELTKVLVRRYPKSYWLWNHRRWALEQFDKPPWHAELSLCSKMLDLDARNFHAWDYRRWVLSHMPKFDVRQELTYSFKKISQNFSNYSAWHYRSKLLSSRLDILLEDYQQELECIHSAIYTEPFDQSAWLYYRWFVGKMICAQDQVSITVYRDKDGFYWCQFYFISAVSLSNQFATFSCNGVATSCQWLNEETKVTTQFSQRWRICTRFIAMELNTVEIPAGFFTLRDGTSLGRLQFNIPAFENYWCSPQPGLFSKLAAHIEVVSEIIDEDPGARYAVQFKQYCLEMCQLYSQSIVMNSQQSVHQDKCRVGYYAGRNVVLSLESAISKASSSFNYAGKECPPRIAPKCIAWRALAELNLSNCGLQSIDFISTMPLLVKMDASDNHIANLHVFGPLPNLQSLNIANNLLASSSDLIWFAANANLFINISGNPCVESVGDCRFLCKTQSGYQIDSASDEYWMMKAFRVGTLSDKVMSAFCVGAVLVSGDGHLLSTGYSREIAGNTHAEECCLAKIDNLSGKNLTLYTTMIPCIKRLSGNKSCVSRIIEHGRIRKIVYAQGEPANFVVNQSAGYLLQKAGLEVVQLKPMSDMVAILNGHLFAS
eukprot:Partr_v1_DN27361_c0_g1_i1_m46783 putative Alpha subunit